MQQYTLYILDVEYTISYSKAKSFAIHKISSILPKTCLILDQNDVPQKSSLERLKKRILKMHQKEVKLDISQVNIYVKPKVETKKYPSKCLVF